MKRMLRFLAPAAVAAALATAPGALGAQDFFSRRPDSVPNRILKRWVGAKINGLPLWLDFFGDSMLVVSDNLRDFPVRYALTPRTLIIYGDSTLSHLLYDSFHRHRDTEPYIPGYQFEIRHRFSLEKLLIEFEDVTITMTEQSTLARPMEARWIADLPDGRQMDLLLAGGGRASYRISPGGSRVYGEWDRRFRDLEFDWTPDSLETSDSTLIWPGSFDADGDQIILENVGPGTSVTIFRRIIRR